jgi:hypothetical protein
MICPDCSDTMSYQEHIRAFKCAGCGRMITDAQIALGSLPTPATHDSTILERGRGGTIGGDRGSSRARGRTDRERSASGRSNSRREPHIHGKSDPKPCPRCGCELSDYRMSGRTYKESGVYCCECEYRETTERWRRLDDEL